jgi:hypothetical protein
MDNYNDVVIRNLDLTSQEIFLLKTLEDFYKNEQYFNLLIDIINGTNIISRRTIEYFVTHYSLINKTCYIIDENNNKIKFNVYMSYKDQLKVYRKKYFDPFGRGIRIPFFSNNTCILTTIGQLNFYRWFLSKNIYNYCLENYNIIQNELVNKKSLIIRKKTKYNNTKNTFYKNNYKIQNYSSSNLIVSFNL